MKRADIKIGDRLAYAQRKHSAVREAVVVGLDFHLRARTRYVRDNSKEFPLPGGGVIRASDVQPAGQYAPANCVIVQLVKPDGSLMDPSAVRAQTLLGTYAEVKAAEDAAEQRHREYAQREADIKAANTTKGRALMTRLEALGVKPKYPNGDYDLAKGRVHLYLDDLASILDLIPTQEG